MKKRLMGCLLVVGLAISSVLTAHASKSMGNEFEVTQDSEDEGYTLTEEDTEMPELPEELKDKQVLSPGLRIEFDGSEEKDTHRVEIYVPTLTDDMKNLGAYYYIEEEDRWVYVEAVDVDYENKTVTFEFESGNILVYILADGVAFEDAAVGTSPKTGAESVWMMWLGAAVVLMGCAMVLSRKKRA